MPLLSPYDEVIQARLTPVAPVAPTMPAMSSGAPEDFVTRARKLRESAIAGAPQGIDPRIAAILARREERLAGQEAEIAQQETRSPWDALARAGAAMAASQSPFFGQGVARGVTAGLDELNQGRAEAVRRRMAVGGARDDLDMQRIEQEGAGRRAAIEQLRQDIALSKDLTESEKAVAEIQLKRLEAQYAPDKYKADIRAASALGDERLSSVALNRARVGTEQAQQFKYISEGKAAGGGGGVGKLSMAEVLSEDLDPYMDWMRTKSGEIKPLGGSKMSLPAIDPSKIGELNLSINKLKEIERDLAKGGYSGPSIGMIPEVALPVLAPKTKDIRDRVGTVTQEQLKGILGGQFARVEGEEFFKRGFDTSQPDAVNLKRVRGLRERLENIQNSNVARIERRLTPAMAAKLPPGTQFIGMDGKTYVSRGR